MLPFERTVTVILNVLVKDLGRIMRWFAGPVGESARYDHAIPQEYFSG